MDGNRGVGLTLRNRERGMAKGVTNGPRGKKGKVIGAGGT